MSAALDPEQAAFLAETGRSFLVTRGGDGGPTVHPLGAMVRGSELYFNTYRASAKVRNVARDPHARVIVATADDAEPFRALDLAVVVEVLGPGQGPPDAMAGADSAVMSEESRPPDA